jgi:hypothetical protein
MAAEYYIPQPAPLPLLVEPLQPPRGKRWRRTGWRIVEFWEDRRLVRTAIRDPRYDARGAAIQHAICRYLLAGVSRRQLAAETGYSERQVQAWLGGTACATYAGAVLKRLAGLGVTPGRGHLHRSSPRRIAEINAAQRAILEAVASGRVTGQSVDDARLLLAGREPVAIP